MAVIAFTFDVQGVDPTLVDPQDIADYLFGLHDEDAEAGNSEYELAQDFLIVEWVD